MNWKLHVVRGGRGSLVVDWNNKVNCTRLVWKHTAPCDCVSRVLTIGLSGLSGEWGGGDMTLHFLKVYITMQNKQNLA